MTTLARDSPSIFEFRGWEEDLFCKKRVGGELAYLGGVLP